MKPNRTARGLAGLAGIVFLLGSSPSPAGADTTVGVRYSPGSLCSDFFGHHEVARAEIVQSKASQWKDPYGFIGGFAVSVQGDLRKGVSVGANERIRAYELTQCQFGMGYGAGYGSQTSPAIVGTRDLWNYRYGRKPLALTHFVRGAANKVDYDGIARRIGRDYAGRSATERRMRYCQALGGSVLNSDQDAFVDGAFCRFKDGSHIHISALWDGKGSADPNLKDLAAALARLNEDRYLEDRQRNAADRSRRVASGTGSSRPVGAAGPGRVASSGAGGS